MNIDADGAVIGFDASGPGGAGGGRISHVIRLAAFLVERIMGVLAGNGKGIDALEMIACADCIIARNRDLGSPMPSPISRMTFLAGPFLI